MLLKFYNRLFFRLLLSICLQDTDLFCNREISNSAGSPNSAQRKLTATCYLFKQKTCFCSPSMATLSMNSGLSSSGGSDGKDSIQNKYSKTFLYKIIQTSSKLLIGNQTLYLKMQTCHHVST